MYLTSSVIIGALSIMSLIGLGGDVGLALGLTWKPLNSFTGLCGDTLAGKLKVLVHCDRPRTIFKVKYTNVTRDRKSRDVSIASLILFTYEFCESREADSLLCSFFLSRVQTQVICVFTNSNNMRLFVVVSQEKFCNWSRFEHSFTTRAKFSHPWYSKQLPNDMASDHRRISSNTWLNRRIWQTDLSKPKSKTLPESSIMRKTERSDGLTRRLRLVLQFLWTERYGVDGNDDDDRIVVVVILMVEEEEEEAAKRRRKGGKNRSRARRAIEATERNW